MCRPQRSREGSTWSDLAARVHRESAPERLEQALFEIPRVIRRPGRDSRAGARLPARHGHLLIEGVPGLAKTLTIKDDGGRLGGTFARAVHPTWCRADLVGTASVNTGLADVPPQQLDTVLAT